MKHLFLDLDNTIFAPRSIPLESVMDFYRFMSGMIKGTKKGNGFYNDFISLSFPDLLDKYQITTEHFKEAYAQRHFFNGTLDISPFPDYDNIRKLSNPKYLVTSGFTDFQWQKINSLGIKNDFVQIIIDDPIYNPIGKKKAFELLMNQHKLSKKDVLVIGDNPQAEIKYGKEIGLKTILIDRKQKYENKETDADWTIRDFNQLSKIGINLNIGETFNRKISS